MVSSFVTAEAITSVTMSWTDVLRAGCKALAASPGWSNGSVDLPCHPGFPRLACRAEDTDVSLYVCLECLQAYIECSGVMVGPEAPKPSVSSLTRACRRCDGEFPLGDFVSRTGAITVNCTDCRMAWGKQKQAEEAAANAAREAVEREAAVDGLRRIEAELQQEFRDGLARIEAQVDDEFWA